MAVPKRKTSVSKKKMRRSHHKLSALNIVEEKKVESINFHTISILNLVFTTEKKFQIFNNKIMSKKISIAIDAMGGDNSPDKIIEGIKIFLENNINKDDFILNLFGKENVIKEKLSKYKISSDLINVINSNSIWREEAILLLINYFNSKGEKDKSNEYNELLTSKK